VHGKLVAWLKPHEGGIEALFVADGTEREPASRRFADTEEARFWILAEAAAIGADVVWAK
jgi:hypothetical protein